MLFDRSRSALLIGAVSLSLFFSASVDGQWTFIRGDANGDGIVNIADPITSLDFLFASGLVNCDDALDVNDDGAVDIADPISTLTYLFIVGGASPAFPFPDCGLDPTRDGLDCLGPILSCPAADLSPIITSTPVSTATEGQPYTYVVVATDPNPGDTIVFSLQASPSGATINESTGEIVWTPSELQASETHAFTVRATDSTSLFDDQSFDVFVVDADQPVITSTPVGDATEARLYVYDVEASDTTPGDSLVFSLEVGPLGGTIDASTGLILWTPSASQAGQTHQFTVRVTDLSGLFDEQSFPVFVLDVDQPPVFTSTPPAFAYAGVPFAYALTATDPDTAGPMTFDLTGPAGVTLVSGVIIWTPTTGQLGANSFLVTASTPSGRSADQTFSIEVLDPATLPPDPTLIAPPHDPTENTLLPRSVSFLYTASPPVQAGMSPETIVAERVTILRGTVRNQAGDPLPGASVTILNRPEYGSTVTRLDGQYDLVAKGGGLLTVCFRMIGHVEVQRRVRTQWLQYRPLEEVVLVPHDVASTTITTDGTSAAMAAAQGSPSVDTDGTRVGTLLLPIGVVAGLRLPGGDLVPQASLDVRITELTVGENGEAAMPADLPATSAYTYCVELSADQATGGARVEFDQPVPYYVENFLGFEAGTAVPHGYYDRDEGRWIPAVSGIVLDVVSTAGGSATLDISGDGLPDDLAELEALGITTAERDLLATLYTDGDSLWRVPLNHFSPHDFNYGPSLPPDSEQPVDLPPKDRESLPGSAVGVGVPLELSAGDRRFVVARRNDVEVYSEADVALALPSEFVGQVVPLPFIQGTSTPVTPTSFLSSYDQILVDTPDGICVISTSSGSALTASFSLATLERLEPGPYDPWSCSVGVNTLYHVFDTKDPEFYVTAQPSGGVFALRPELEFARWEMHSNFQQGDAGCSITLTTGFVQEILSYRNRWEYRQCQGGAATTDCKERIVEPLNHLFDYDPSGVFPWYPVGPKARVTFTGLYIDDLDANDKPAVKDPTIGALPTVSLVHDSLWAVRVLTENESGEYCEAAYQGHACSYVVLLKPEFSDTDCTSDGFQDYQEWLDDPTGHHYEPLNQFFHIYYEDLQGDPQFFECEGVLVPQGPSATEEVNQTPHQGC